MIRAVAILSPPHSYYNSTGRQYSGSASPNTIATQTLTEINAMPQYGDDVAGSTACVGSGAVCVTGNTVAGKIIDGVPELITVVCDVVSW